ncbi:uncharacterized protein LOC123298354 [Chrysoperla carnea]|uniref:uncharacterized protein LOC123298354 n=1 Tax=Chrysoperla carnea TaxID=189513 RepID=UPI001D06DFAB|nr:uncharacterized protein LOC123298354 [Chrysoperla carnea]
MTDEDNANGLEKNLKDLEISNRLPSVAVLDEFLPIEMNPFQRIRPRSRSTGSICTCSKRSRNHQLNENSKTIAKKNSKKLLRDPVLKYVSKHVLDELSINKTSKSLSLIKKFNVDPKEQLTDLLDGCERLSIGSDSKNKSKSSQESRTSNSNNSSCSQEAIAGMGITPPCDVTMDELASYFETFVHIPKKMSSMAEMMYI